MAVVTENGLVQVPGTPTVRRTTLRDLPRPFATEVTMSVRAKVRVESVEYNNNAAGERESARVLARPVYDPDPTSENGRFFRWTPGGQIDLQVVNLDAADQFSVGDEFYVDFTKVEQLAPAE